MNDARIINACIKHENPVSEALDNKYKCRNYRTNAYGPTLNKLSPETSHARIMIHLFNNPGLTREQCREQLQYKMRCSDVFCHLTNMKLIVNKRPGYVITDLGIALLHHFKLI